MSLRDRIIDHLSEIQQEMLRDRHPYLTIEVVGFSRKWVLKQHGYGCRPVKAQAAISMAKNPPPLPGVQANPAAATPSAPAKSPEAINEPASASTTKKAAAQQAQDELEDCPQPPPFDMLDIPIGMDAMGYTYAAKYARHWFNGQAHVIPDKSSASVGKAFVDDSSCKLNWVRKFGKVQKRYDHLLSSTLKSNDEENIFNDAARNYLTSKFQAIMAQPNPVYSGTLDTLAACGNDIQLLHQRFQFQRAEVSMADVLGSYTTVMNDLAASLANFNFYAAVAMARISSTHYNRYDRQPWQRCVHTKVDITHVYVYVKDVYSFNDPAGKRISQYLGHWNRQGVIITVDAAAAEQISKLSRFFEHERDSIPRWYLPPVPEHLGNAVDVKSRLRKEDVFYPVRNRDFQQWRSLKSRGGDFLIFSDLARIRLQVPIQLDLGEVCR